MFIVNNKSFRKRELNRLRVAKFRKARHQLSYLEQSVSLDSASNENVNLSDSEMPRNLLPMDNTDRVTGQNPVCEQMNEEVFNEESVMDISVSDNLEQNNESSFEHSVDEQFRNITVTSDSDSDNEINNAMDNLNVIDKIRQWALINPLLPHTRLEQLMDILREQYPDLPKSAKTFLGTNSSTYKIENFGNDEEFVYFGIKTNLEKCINIKLHETNDIELLINVDGVPLFKSSRKQLWPILCQVFSHYNHYKPFPAAIYCGNSKPSDVHCFLAKFIEEINELQNTGVMINNRLFNVSIKGFVCDRPARSLLKIMKNHGGYYACERCTVKGQRYKKRTIYPLTTNCTLRTDESFRNQSNSEHHTGMSPLLLIEPKIDLVNQFVLDPMHLLFLGVMKKLLECWIDGTINKKLKISNTDKTRLSSLLTKIKVPAEFQRSTRSLTDFNKFKSTEFQFLLLYAGPVVFKKILAETVYKHFLLLHVGCRILCSSEIAVQKTEHAKMFLTSFVRIAPLIYTLQFLVGNIHSVYHLADDVAYMQCCLSGMSSYSFENLLGKIKKLLRSGNKPLAQLCCRFNEISTSMCPKPKLSETIEIVKEFKDDDIDEVIIKRIKLKNVLLTTKAPNNTVLLENNEIFEIHKIFRFSMDNSILTKISGKILKKKKPLFTYPCNSEHLEMWKVSAKSKIMATYKVTQIAKKMLCIDLSSDGNEKLYVMPLLHM
ncbi:uncharacterized protein LOC141536876 [Cotesia typhae]|uniref:uncharacterized protein LOC141536876 n=1 Tax=Cotesia typhae TaxID=2053667 RepID=UPI003D682A80